MAYDDTKLKSILAVDWITHGELAELSHVGIEEGGPFFEQGVDLVVVRLDFVQDFFSASFTKFPPLQVSGTRRNTALGIGRVKRAFNGLVP